jgi:hypothetical protein
MATQELKAIDEGRSDPSQRGMAKAAQIVGIAGVAIAVLLLILAVVAFGALSLAPAVG